MLVAVCPDDLDLHPSIRRRVRGTPPRPHRKRGPAGQGSAFASDRALVLGGPSIKASR
jgi:hypothetical protein